MIYVYIGIPAICLLLALIFRNYKKNIFKNLDKKEHPLRFFYPATARVLDLFKAVYPNKAHSKVTIFLKQLCVRENVEAECYIYNIKKVSTITAVFLALCIVGMLLFITSNGSTIISSLSRAKYGKGQTSYQLDVEYDNTTETMEITIDAAEMTEDEIMETFDSDYDAIVETLLDENSSLDAVSKPLNFITSYDSITISWQIEDTSLISYNGDISDDVSENEFIPVNLYATFTISDISEVFCIPVVLTGQSVSSRELLIENIYESIEKNNSAYEENVELPDSINGKKLTFRTINEHTDITLMVLGLVCIFVIILLYDRSLEKKLKLRNEELTMDFTEIVFKLSLLYEAGLSIYKAWERIVTDYEQSHPGKRNFAYREMRLTLEQIKNGAPEARAYGQFGKRCGLHIYIKFGNLLEQNLSKGSRGLKNLLRQEAQDSFDSRKRLARKKGEEASTKMMIPMIMMLVVVLVIVAVPAVLSIQF